ERPRAARGPARDRCPARAARRASRRRPGRSRDATLPVNPLPPSLRFLERDWLSSNQVVGMDGDEATVVDTGYAKHAALTVELVGHVLAQSGARLTGVVNTHLHSDHCGGNRALVDAFDCAVTIPRASAPE